MPRRPFKHLIFCALLSGLICLPLFADEGGPKPEIASIPALTAVEAKDPDRVHAFFKNPGATEAQKIALIWTVAKFDDVQPNPLDTWKRVRFASILFGLVGNDTEKISRVTLTALRRKVRPFLWTERQDAMAGFLERLALGQRPQADEQQAVRDLPFFIWGVLKTDTPSRHRDQINNLFRHALSDSRIRGRFAPELRRAIVLVATISGETPQQNAVAAFPFLIDGDSFTRQLAIAAIDVRAQSLANRLNNDQLQPILKLLKNTNTPWQAMAFIRAIRSQRTNSHAVAQMVPGDAETAQALAETATSTFFNPDVRLEALETLGAMKYPEAVSQAKLLTLWKKDARTAISDAAYEALTRTFIDDLKLQEQVVIMAGLANEGTASGKTSHKDADEEANVLLTQERIRKLISERLLHRKHLSTLLTVMATYQMLSEVTLPAGAQEDQRKNLAVLEAYIGKCYRARKMVLPEGATFNTLADRLETYAKDPADTGLLATAARIGLAHMHGVKPGKELGTRWPRANARGTVATAETEDASAGTSAGEDERVAADENTGADEDRLVAGASDGEEMTAMAGTDGTPEEIGAVGANVAAEGVSAGENADEGDDEDAAGTGTQRSAKKTGGRMYDTPPVWFIELENDPSVEDDIRHQLKLVRDLTFYSVLNTPKRVDPAADKLLKRFTETTRKKYATVAARLLFVLAQYDKLLNGLENGKRGGGLSQLEAEKIKAVAEKIRSVLIKSLEAIVGSNKLALQNPGNKAELVSIRAIVRRSVSPVTDTNCLRVKLLYFLHPTYNDLNDLLKEASSMPAPYWYAAVSVVHRLADGKTSMKERAQKIREEWSLQPIDPKEAGAIASGGVAKEPTATSSDAAKDAAAKVEDTIDPPVPPSVDAAAEKAAEQQKAVLEAAAPGVTNFAFSEKKVALLCQKPGLVLAEMLQFEEPELPLEERVRSGATVAAVAELGSVSDVEIVRMAFNRLTEKGEQNPSIRILAARILVGAADLIPTLEAATKKELVSKVLAATRETSDPVVHGALEEVAFVFSGIKTAQEAVQSFQVCVAELASKGTGTAVSSTPPAGPPPK